jgi:hypothetical protein
MEADVMAKFDLSKQVGPLPLGAWIIVVGAGLGIAFYTRQQNAPPVEVTDQSGDPGVGTGAVGGWVPTTPPEQQVNQPITTNDQWADKAIRHLIASNYNPVIADSAVRNYLGGIKLSIQETALIAIVLTAIGPPPQSLPPVEGGTGTNPPPPGGTEPQPTYVNVAKGFVWKNFISWLRSRGYDPKREINFFTIYTLNPLFLPTSVRNGIVTRNSRIRIR